MSAIPATGFTDASGNANATITTVQGGTAVTNTPFTYASVSGHIDGTVSGAPPVTEVGLLDFGSGTGNQLHVGGFGYVNGVIEAAPGGVDVQVDNNGQLFVGTNQAVPTFNVQHSDRGHGRRAGPHHHPAQHQRHHPGGAGAKHHQSIDPRTPRSACNSAALFPRAPPRPA